MPLFDIEDDNGNPLTIEGDSPPTEKELEEIFSLHFPTKGQPSDFRGEEARQIPDLQATTRGGPKAYIPDFDEVMANTGEVFNEGSAGLGNAVRYAGNVARGLTADVAAGMSLLKRKNDQTGVIDTIKENLPFAAEASGNLPAAFSQDPETARLPIDERLAEAASEPGGIPAATLGHVSQDVAATAPLLAVGALPSWAVRLVSAGFSAHMIASAPKLFEEYADEINKPEEEQDPDKIASLQSSITQTFGFAPMAGAHGVGGASKALSNAFENANRFAPGPKTGGPRASDVPRPPLEMPMRIEGGDQNASEVSQAAEVHGDVRPPERQGEQEGLPLEEGGEGVLPQTERGILEHHRKYYGNLLENPDLLNKSVEIGPFLAVPLGGGRRAGTLGELFETKQEAQAVAEQLKAKDPEGFKNARIREERNELGQLVGRDVIWGDDLMDMPTYSERGRALGYKESSIKEFVEKHSDTPYSAPPKQGVLTPEEGSQFKELQDKFFGGGEMTAEEIDMLDAFDARNREQMKARIEGQEPPQGMISETEKLINQAVRDEGILDRTEMADVPKLEPENPMNFRVAQYNVRTGKIQINGRALAREIEALPPERRAQAVRSIINEENVHSHTTPQEAQKFGSLLSTVERKLGARIYTGKWSGEHPGFKLNDKMLGYEVIRRRVQRLNRMTPTEIAKAVGKEKWTLESLDLLDRIIGKSREFLSDAGKDQRATLERVRNNLKIAKEVVTGGVGSPGALAKEDRPKTVEDFVSRMGSEKFSTPEAVDAGFKAKSVADLDSLLNAKNDIKAKMAEARKSGDFNSMFKLGNDNQILREAIETATDAGSNRSEMRRPHEEHYGEEPPLSWKNNPEVRDWLEKNGKDAGIELPEESPAALRDESERKSHGWYDSGVLTKDGSPITVYHGSPADRIGQGKLKAPVFVTPDKKLAEHYKGVKEVQGELYTKLERFGRVYSAHIKFKNPMEWTEGRGIPVEEAKRIFDTTDHDAIINLKNKEYALRNPDQVLIVDDSGNPAALSKKDARRMEELRKYKEAMGLRPETPVERKGEAVAPEERVSAEQVTGIAPKTLIKTAADMDAAADAEMAGPISSDARPSFDNFDKLVRYHNAFVKPEQLRDMWEDSVWSNLLNASPQRLTEWRKSLGLEAKYGRGQISDKKPPEGFRLEEGNKVLAKQNRASAEARERYRNKVISAIARKLIGESVQERAALNRTEVTIDDVAFDNPKSKPYSDISAHDIAKEGELNKILRDQARGRNTDPESASRRLVAVVNRKTGDVELLSTYNDNGIQRVTDPAGARMTGKPSRVLDDKFLRQYRPFATVLLRESVKGFRQNFASVGEFTDKIGKEAKERSAVGEFPGEGPAPEDFVAEGTPGLEGEGGSFQGPKRALVSGVRGGTLESGAPITPREALGVLEQAFDEVGEVHTADDFKMALLGLLDKQARGRMTPLDHVARSGYRKMLNAMQQEFPDLSREEILDRLAARLDENNKSAETLDAYTKKTVAQFKGQNPEDAGPTVAPERGEELTMPIERRPPTDVRPENIPPGTPPVEREAPPSAQLGSETPVREPFIPEVSPEQEAIQRNAAARAGKEYQVGQDWAAAFEDVSLMQRIQKRDIRTIRDRVRREQGINLTPSEAKKILEAKKAFKPPMEMTNRALMRRAEAAENKDLMTDNPAALRTVREGIDPDTKSPIPRLVPNISTAMTRAMGLERIPLIGRLWGERAKIRDDADRQMVGYGIKRAIGNSQAAIIGAREAALTKELGNPFEQGPDGKFLNVRADKSQSLYPSDLFEDWQRQVVVPEKMRASGKFNSGDILEYKRKHPMTMALAPGQEKMFRSYLQVIEDGYKYLEEKNANLETYGGESKETRRDQLVMHGLPKGVEVYPMPRLALYKREIGPIKTEIMRRIGGSYQIERDRLYKTEAEGQRTTAYENDMNKRLATFVQRIYKAVADADLANSPALKGETVEQRIPRLAKEYEAELRLPVGEEGRMTQQDIIDLAYKPRLGVEGQVQHHPAFAEKIYPIDIANRLNKYFGDRAQRYIRTLSELSTIEKTVMLTGDLAQYMQQGSLLMTRHPRIWGRATAKSILSLADPHVTGNLLRNPENFKAATEFVQGGGSLGHLQDFMSGARPGEFLTKIPVIKQVILRSGRAFGTFQDIAKLEVWKSMRENTPKEQWPEVIEMIENLGLSGKMEQAGMSPARAIGERLLMMAPAYYRGAMNAVAGAFESGKAGAESRRSLAQYAAGWTTFMVSLYVLAGMSKEEITKRLTPGQNNQKFLKYPVKVGDDTIEIGPGGIVLSMLNLGTDMAVTTATKPGDMVSFKNPALQWMQQRLGPIPSLARKVATGEDVFGRKTGPLQAVTAGTFPIPAQKGYAAAMSSNPYSGAVSAGASFFGLDARKYHAATDVYQMAEDFMKKEGLKKESGFDEVANDEPAYSKLRASVGAESQRKFNQIKASMTESRTDLDLIKNMKKWRNSPFTGNEKAEKLFRASLTPYEEKLYDQAQDDRQRVFDRFLDMMEASP